MCGKENIVQKLLQYLISQEGYKTVLITVVIFKPSAVTKNSREIPERCACAQRRPLQKLSMLSYHIEQCRNEQDQSRKNPFIDEAKTKTVFMYDRRKLFIVLPILNMQVRRLPKALKSVRRANIRMM